MTLWIVLTAVALVTAIALAAAVIQRVRKVPAATEINISSHTDQIMDLASKREKGLLDASSVKIARKQIEQDILAQVSSFGGGDALPRTGILALAAVGGLVIAGSAVLYGVAGPTEPSTIQLASRSPAAAPVLWPFDAQLKTKTTAPARASTSAMVARPSVPGSAEELIDKLAARLKINPDDAEGWRMLGWSYFNTQDYDNAAEAYARAIAIQDDDSDVHSAYGETLVRAARGFVTEDALKAFDRTLVLNSADPRAGFFKGLALEQDGKPQEAVNAWIDILKSAPADADWIEDLTLRVREVAANASIDITGRLPDISGQRSASPASAAPDKGPTAADMKAAQSMPPEDRQEMIRGMVDRLANRLQQNPDDAEGWIKLMRSRMVLGDEDEALSALRRANEVFADVPNAQARIAMAAAELGLTSN